MSAAEELPGLRTRLGRESAALAGEWRRFKRTATVVAILTSPAFFLVLYRSNDWSLPASLLCTIFGVIAFRGLVDVVIHKVIPWPNLYGAHKEVQDEDVVARRRVWFWRTMYRRLVWLVIVLFVLLVITNLILRLSGTSVSLLDTIPAIGQLMGAVGPQLLILALQLPMFFFINFAILFGPLVFFGIKQMKGYEPGDADWGVKLEDVRGQAEAKEEITRVISLWQSGEAFEKSGGKRERGLLFLGAPGTGKTMLSKAIATSFNSPFVTMPGSGFAQTFIGMDVIIVLFLITKARRLARKWGGQCIVFIDEIDAVGMRRQALQQGVGSASPGATGMPSIHDFCFHGRDGAITPTGDLVLETRAWRERLFEARAPERRGPLPPSLAGLVERIQGYMIPGGMMGGGGQLALNQLLVQMDGVDDPPFMKKFVSNRVNTFLDAMYIVPQKIGSMRLRLKAPRPRPEQIYFIGATNVPIEVLDPALIRPGRMGRHIWFRTPTQKDRKDIFELYMSKVSHQSNLDTEKRRDELSRITNGYSPAMIEQVCSMALTYAHSEGREEFEWPDIVEAMTTIETGTAVGIEYIPAETRAVAIHEAGHAAAGHAFMKGVLSTRLSIRMRAGSLGHHQAIEKDERFSAWRSEQFARLIWTLGAMAAEQVFYDENSTGVGGDVQSATAMASLMVGVWAMGPEQPDFNGSLSPVDDEEKARERIEKRFERIGSKIMNRAGAGGPFTADPIAAVLGDSDKRKSVAILLGQAYLQAYALIAANKDKVEKIAEELIERREMHGDEVVDLLDSVHLEKPEIDLLDDKVWPAV